LPQYRGQRLYSALLSYIVAALREEGVQRVWIGAGLKNRASLRGFANAGFQLVIVVTYARVHYLRCLWIGDHPGASRELIAAARRAFIADCERLWGPFALGWSPPPTSTARAEIEV
jgi:GNAT superfamily N-acetyltransferase